MYVCVYIYIGIESLACEGRVPLACPRGQSVEPLPKGQRQRLLKSPLCSDLKYYYTNALTFENLLQRCLKSEKRKAKSEKRKAL